jgi:N-acyl-D-amino-acid deacylase
MPDVPMHKLRELYEYPYLIPGNSDGGAHTRCITSSRFPTDYIARGARDYAWITPEEAHRRLSGQPTRTLGITDGGPLVEGAAADVVVYDFEALGPGPIETAHDVPGNGWCRVQRPTGYRYIFVNGELTMENGAQTERHSGRLLRAGRPSA